MLVELVGKSHDHLVWWTLICFGEMRYSCHMYVASSLQVFASLDLMREVPLERYFSPTVPCQEEVMEKMMRGGTTTQK